MKTFIAETVQVHSAARKPDSCSDHGHNGKAAAFRCALLVLLALGLLGGIGQTQNALVIDPNGGVSIAKNAKINNVFLGDVGHGPGWAGFASSGSATREGYALLQSSDGLTTLINKKSGAGLDRFSHR